MYCYYYYYDYDIDYYYYYYYDYYYHEKLGPCLYCLPFTLSMTIPWIYTCMDVIPMVLFPSMSVIRWANAMRTAGCRQ